MNNMVYCAIRKIAAAVESNKKHDPSSSSEHRRARAQEVRNPSTGEVMDPSADSAAIRTGKATPGEIARARAAREARMRLRQRLHNGKVTSGSAGERDNMWKQLVNPR